MISKKIISICCLSLTLLIGVSFSSPTTAFATDKNEIESTTTVNQELLNESLIQKANQYVKTTENSFYLSEEGKIKLNESEQKIVLDSIQNANEYLKSIDNDLIQTEKSFLVTDEIIEKEVSTQNTSVKKINTLSAKKAKFKQGVNKIEFHWWGMDVYLSKSTVVGIGAGVTIAGIWIPHPIVSKATSTLGVVIGLCPGGIKFKFNYLKAGLGAITSPKIFVGNLNAAGWLKGFNGASFQ